jgi:hypothetical protein
MGPAACAIRARCARPWRLLKRRGLAAGCVGSRGDDTISVTCAAACRSSQRYKSLIGALRWRHSEQTTAGRLASGCAVPSWRSEIIPGHYRKRQ